MQQTTNNIMLVRPANFGFNEETAVSNAFQVNSQVLTGAELKEKVQAEFDRFVDTLRKHGVNAIVVDDTEAPIKPDAVFPNNWVTFHEDGTVILYPMHALNRRLERRLDVVEQFREQYQVGNLIDLSVFEADSKFLEGTGSIVFDHPNKLAYACLSPRTDKGLLEHLCDLIGYKAVTFYALDKNGKEIYHTNVMMCVAEQFAVICLASITDATEKAEIKMLLETTGHEIVDITWEQMDHFAGNMLSVATPKKDNILVLSLSAYNALTEAQIRQIEQYNELVPIDIETIETIGGGSARCMMAQVFLPVKGWN